MDEAAVPHRDELRVVEDHHQTEHKLDLIRRYYGAYLSIVARARRLPNNREAWIVDTHAGAGLHRSREDPDQRRFGSPLIACSQARLAQRLHAGFCVHVRAIERDVRWQARLDRRVRHGERAEDRVAENAAASATTPTLRTSRPHWRVVSSRTRPRSLWTSKRSVSSRL